MKGKFHCPNAVVHHRQCIFPFFANSVCCSCEYNIPHVSSYYVWQRQRNSAAIGRRNENVLMFREMRQQWRVVLMAAVLRSLRPWVSVTLLSLAQSQSRICLVARSYWLQRCPCRRTPPTRSESGSGGEFSLAGGADTFTFSAVINPHKVLRQTSAVAHYVS